MSAGGAALDNGLEGGVPTRLGARTVPPIGRFRRQRVRRGFKESALLFSF